VILETNSPTSIDFYLMMRNYDYWWKRWSIPSLGISQNILIAVSSSNLAFNRGLMIVGAFQPPPESGLAPTHNASLPISWWRDELIM
jgi:hypothetical protein